MKIQIAKKDLVVYDRTESVLASWLRDGMTLVMLAFGVYISRESTWWTFVAGLMFIIFVFAKSAAIGRERSAKFKSWAEFKAWVNQQAEDEKG